MSQEYSRAISSDEYLKNQEADVAPISAMSSLTELADALNTKWTKKEDKFKNMMEKHAYELAQYATMRATEALDTFKHSPVEITVDFVPPSRSHIMSLGGSILRAKVLLLLRATFPSSMEVTMESRKHHVTFRRKSDRISEEEEDEEEEEEYIHY